MDSMCVYQSCLVSEQAQKRFSSELAAATDRHQGTFVEVLNAVQHSDYLGAKSVAAFDIRSAGTALFATTAMIVDNKASQGSNFACLLCTINKRIAHHLILGASGPNCRISL